MSKLQDILDQLDRIMSQRTTKDEAVDLIVKAVHEIASDHHALKSKVGESAFFAGPGARGPQRRCFLIIRMRGLRSGHSGELL